MSDITGSVKLTGYISPTDTLDSYPTHYSIYGKGGLKSVDNGIMMGLIPTSRILTGSLTYVIDEDKYYMYDGSG